MSSVASVLLSSLSEDEVAEMIGAVVYGPLWGDVSRFAKKVELQGGPLADPCWLWRGARSRGQGNIQWYGSFSCGGAVVRAHKWSFVNIGRGLLLPGQHLDHLCVRSLCVCPRHLEAVTREENQARKSGRNCELYH